MKKVQVRGNKKDARLLQEEIKKKKYQKRFLAMQCQDPSTWSLRIGFQHSSSMHNETECICEVLYLC